MDFCHFSQKIPLLVSCCSFCSFELTEDLTGLHGIPTSDWLHVNCFKRSHVGEKECRNKLVLLFFSTFHSSISQLPGGKVGSRLVAALFLHAKTTTKTICTAGSAVKRRWRYIFVGEKVLVQCLSQKFSWRRVDISSKADRMISEIIFSAFLRPLPMDQCVLLTLVCSSTISNLELCSTLLILESVLQCSNFLHCYMSTDMPIFVLDLE